jgi:hypothetical protein
MGIMQLYPIHEFALKNGCQYADGGFGDLNPILCHRKWSLRDRCYYS